MLSHQTQPSECGRQCTLNILHAQTAAQQQSNGSYEARMSGKCGEWGDQFIMTLSTFHWVPVQDKGSKILCVKLGAMKVIPSVRPVNLSDTAATSQYGSSLEFIALIAGRQCYIQDASGRGLCRAFDLIPTLTAGPEYQLSADIHSYKTGTKYPHKLPIFFFFLSNPKCCCIRLVLSFAHSQ